MIFLAHFTTGISMTFPSNTNAPVPLKSILYSYSWMMRFANSRLSLDGWKIS